MYAHLGDLKLGISNILTGPIASDESLGNTINEYAVLRGKPVPVWAGEELDLRNFAFFFDETFCDPDAEYSKLKKARSDKSAMALVMGNGTYLGKKYWIEGVNITWLKTTPGGKLVRLEAGISLKEVPRGAASIPSGIAGIAGIARALSNPFARR